MTEPRELQALLAWCALPGVGERTLLALLDHAREARTTLAGLWTAPVEDLAALVPLSSRSTAALQNEAAERWRSAGQDAEAVRGLGVDVFLAPDPDAPSVLHSDRRRPFLFAYGATGLLEEPSVAILNSQTVTNAGLAVTDALADALARRDVPLVTSTSRESYQAAAIAAKRQAGPALLVLDRGVAEAFPAGLEREPVAPARVWDAAFDPDLQLLLSPFGWRERWNARSGPRRDGLIADLAAVLVAVDLRPEGTMERECRRALDRGKPVLALDRGPDTPEGTRRLWEDGGATRVRWTGSEDAVREVLAALPGERPEVTGDRSGQGWQREIAGFLARACALLTEGSAGPRRVAAFPASGDFARTALSWSTPGSEGTAGATWLLAELASGERQPASRPRQLLERVARGGVLAAVVPVAWLQDEGLHAARKEWLERGTLRLAVRLPGPVSGSGEPTAAIFLERDGQRRGPAPTFAPERDPVGRFHLRRYLQEVLAQLGQKVV